MKIEDQPRNASEEFNISSSSKQSNFQFSQSEYRRMALKIAAVFLLWVNCALCCITLSFTIYLNDRTNIFRRNFGISYSIVLVILNLIQFYALMFKRDKLIYPILITVTMSAVMVSLIMAFWQLAYDSLNHNGSGKIPLVDPHTEKWYKIDKSFTNLTYIISGSVVFQQIITYLFIRQMNRDKDKMDLPKVNLFQEENEVNDIQKSFLISESEQQISENKLLVDESYTSQDKPQKLSVNTDKEENIESFANFNNTIPTKRQRAMEYLQNVETFSHLSDKQISNVDQKQLFDNEMKKASEDHQKSWKNSLQQFYNQ